MDGRLCVAFDQPDVKEEKKSHSLFISEWHSTGAVCVWPVSDLYSTKRDERKSTTPNSSRSLCVSPSFGSRATCRQGKSTRKLDKSLSISFFLSTPRPVGFFFIHNIEPHPARFLVQSICRTWVSLARRRIGSTYSPGSDIKSFLAFLSKSSSLPLCSHSRCLGFTSPAAAAAAESEQTQTETPTIFSWKVRRPLVVST